MQHYHNKIINESGNVAGYMIALKEKIKNELIPSCFRKLKDGIKESAYMKDFKSRVERIKQEESLKRVNKMFEEHDAEREKIEKERMRKFEEEWVKRKMKR